MTSPAVERLAKWRQCKGCEGQALCQPFGPEGEWLCEMCWEALAFPDLWRTALPVFVFSVLALSGGCWWLLG